LSIEVAERNSKISRNDLCPCGSGKKFKRCCLDAGLLNNRGKKLVRDVISPFEIKDGGEPQVDESFFQQNPIRQLSAQRMIYSDVMDPWVEPMISHWVRQTLSRGEEEERKINATDDPVELIAILKARPDRLHHHLLIGKILERGQVAIPLLIEELPQAQEDCFIELAARILGGSPMNCTYEIERLIQSTPLDAYLLSLLCLVLGIIGGPEALKLLWDRFHFFKEKYPKENYSQGPLLGLWELRDKLPLLCVKSRC